MKNFIIPLISFLMAAGISSAQEIELTVEKPGMDALTPSQKDYLADFQSKVSAYVNEHRWTDVDFYGDKIPVTLNINFISGTDGGDFTAQVAFISQRRIYEDGRPTQKSSLILRLMDTKWAFSYIKGQPFYHDEFQFNSITSFLDFYMYVVVGLDFDSMEYMMGTTYYQKAFQIYQRSQSSSSQSEWQGTSNQYSRNNLISELMNGQFENFRSAMYWYYYEGIDFMATEKDEAKKSVAKALELIADLLVRTNIRSIILNLWLESKASEFCTLLEGYPKRAQLMSIMLQADPQRVEQYRKCNF
jgi:hypothetical protein